MFFACADIIISLPIDAFAVHYASLQQMYTRGCGYSLIFEINTPLTSICCPFTAQFVHVVR